MLTLVRAPVETPDDALPIVALRVDRTRLC
jgi:hypothetical protein